MSRPSRGDDQMIKPMTAIEAFSLYDRAAAILTGLQCIQADVSEAAETTPVVADALRNVLAAINTAHEALSSTPDALYDIHRTLYLKEGDFNV